MAMSTVQGNIMGTDSTNLLKMFSTNLKPLVTEQGKQTQFGLGTNRSLLVFDKSIGYRKYFSFEFNFPITNT